MIKNVLMEEYASDILPNIKEYMDDLYTEYDRGGAIEKQSLNKKRFADSPEMREILMAELQEAGLRDQALNESYQIDGSDRADSPGSNRDRSLVVDSGGGDVNIGADFMGRRGKGKNGKNGNGNGDGNGNGNGMY